jgi:hypothetical protein
MAILDKRRTDERTPVNSEPFCFSSCVLTPKDIHIDIILGSFPKGNFAILAPPVVEVIEAFDGAAALDFGRGTILTDQVSNGGVLTVVDQDEYVKNADLTLGTIGIYQAATSDLVAALGAGTGDASLIKGAAAVVPCITAVLGGAPTVGKARFHMILMRLQTAG